LSKLRLKYFFLIYGSGQPQVRMSLVIIRHCECGW
jgi:hypothetical protein